MANKIIPSWVPIDMIYYGKIDETGRLDLKMVQHCKFMCILGMQIGHSEWGASDQFYLFSHNMSNRRKEEISLQAWKMRQLSPKPDLTDTERALRVGAKIAIPSQ